MADPRTPEFWTCDDTTERLSCSTIADAVDQWADNVFPAALPEFVTVYGFAPKVLPEAKLARRVLRDALEFLDEDHSDPDGDGTEPTPAMHAAAEAFARVICSQYEVWACEQVATETVRVADHVDLWEYATEQRRDAERREKAATAFPAGAPRPTSDITFEDEASKAIDLMGRLKKSLAKSKRRQPTEGRSDA